MCLSRVAASPSVPEPDYDSLVAAPLIDSCITCGGDVIHDGVVCQGRVFGC